VTNVSPEIPYSRWQPLAVTEAAQLFAGVPFTWGLAGGYAIEQFLGRSIREHGDIDVIIFRDAQLQFQGWLADWLLYAADPPGTLRAWTPGEQLPPHVHDIWGHRRGATAWQLQAMLVDTHGQRWVSRHDQRIHGPRERLIVSYGDLPCVRVEVQLLYKARSRRPKDELDFASSLPHLPTPARSWLRDRLRLLYPGGHPWIEPLG
jgi:hypothetical protein